jgi:hypothetical protein
VWLPLPPEPPSIPAEFTAKTVVVDGAFSAGTDLVLSDGSWHWRVGHLGHGPTPDCARSFSLTAVEAQADGARMTADRITACAGGGWSAQGLHLEAPTLRFDADATAAPTAGVYVADGVRWTGCGCDDPPWTLSARRIEVSDGVACATWPVLRLGNLPVLTVPRWTFPVQPRRFGLLPPELGWRGDDGPALMQPLFVPLGPSADLTPAAGWETGTGPRGRVGSRWHVSTRHRGNLAVGGDARGVEAEGAGTLGGAAAHLTLEGRFASSEDLYSAHARAPEEARAPYVAGRLGVATADEAMAAGLRWSSVADRRVRGRTGLPMARLALSSPGDHLRLDADLAVQAVRTSVGGSPDVQHLTSGLSASAADHWGPVRLGARVASATLAVQTESTHATAVGGSAGGTAEISIRRRGAGTTHTVTFSVDGIAAAAGTSGASSASPVVAARPEDRLGAWAAVTNRLLVGETTAGLRAAWGRFDAATRLRGAARDRPWAELSLEGPAFGSEALWDGDRGVAARAALGPSAVRLTGAYLHTGKDGPGPLLFAQAPDRALHLAIDASAVQTVRPGLAMAVGPLGAEWEAFVDVNDGRWLGHAGTARWAGRCGCWQAGVRIEQATPAPWPDLWFTLSLTGGD